MIPCSSWQSMVPWYQTLQPILLFKMKSRLFWVTILDLLASKQHPCGVNHWDNIIMINRSWGYGFEDNKISQLLTREDDINQDILWGGIPEWDDERGIGTKGSTHTDWIQGSGGQTGTRCYEHPVTKLRRKEDNFIQKVLNADFKSQCYIHRGPEAMWYMYRS